MPREAFLQQRGNMFPGAALVSWRNELMRTGLHNKMAVNGILVETSTGILFRPSDKVRPVIKFPHNKSDDVRGCIVMYQAPAFKQDKIPDDLYFIVHDPYASDGYGASLGAAYVIKELTIFLNQMT